MNLHVIALTALFGTGLAMASQAATENPRSEPALRTSSNQPSKPDRICELLFKEYFTANSLADRNAAGEIIADRGRTTGFWKVVLVGMREAKAEYLEASIVRILGLMLEGDAHGRYLRSLPPRESPTPGFVCLPDEVVPELIDRAGKAGLFTRDPYTVALMRSQDPRTREFFKQTLGSKGDINVNASTRFHAAVGLAQLGDKAGVEWLIAHIDDPIGGFVYYPRPQRVMTSPSDSEDLSACCVAVLQILSSNLRLKTKADLEDWWKAAQETWSPRWPVGLVDR